VLFVYVFCIDMAGVRKLTRWEC